MVCCVDIDKTQSTILEFDQNGVTGAPRGSMGAEKHGRKTLFYIGCETSYPFFHRHARIWPYESDTAIHTERCPQQFDWGQGIDDCQDLFRQDGGRAGLN